MKAAILCPHPFSSLETWHAKQFSFSCSSGFKVTYKGEINSIWYWLFSEKLWQHGRLRTLVGLVHRESLIFHEHVLGALLLQYRLVADSLVWVQVFTEALAFIIAGKTADVRDGVEDEEHPCIRHQGNGQGGVIPRGSPGPLIPVDVHDDPRHPNTHREQAG